MPLHEIEITELAEVPVLLPIIEAVPEPIVHMVLRHLLEVAVPTEEVAT